MTERRTSKPRTIEMKSWRANRMMYTQWKIFFNNTNSFHSYYLHLGPSILKSACGSYLVWQYSGRCAGTNCVLVVFTLGCINKIIPELHSTETSPGLWNSDFFYRLRMTQGYTTHYHKALLMSLIFITNNKSWELLGLQGLNCTKDKAVVTPPRAPQKLKKVRQIPLFRNKRNWP